MTAKAKSKPASEPDMIPDDLPEGWAEATLGDISERIQYGYTASATHAKGPRFLRITDIQDGKVNWEAVPSCDINKDDAEKYSLKSGDIVFARTGATTGKSFLIRSCPPAVFASYLIRVRGHDLVEPSFLSQYFNTPQYWEFISDNVAGNAQPNCNASKLAALPVSLPPVPEQERLAAKIEELLENVNTSRDRLAKVPKILKAFRKSVLAAACSGHLTEDWRDRNRSLTSATDLLARILAEREKRAKELDFKGASKVVRVDEPDLPEIPDAWAWATLDQAVEEGRPIIYGIIKPGPHDPHGVPYVRVVEMKDGTIAPLAHLRRASPLRAAKFKRATLKGGDLLISKDGTIGKVAVVPAELDGGNITQHLVRASIHHLLSRDYIAYSVQAEHAQRWLIDQKKGVALQGVNVEDFRRLPLPVPPFEEQHEIVRRVDILFKLADKIEKRVEAATKRADKLTQAILAKAFRGELVHTEAELARKEGRDYEPASVLLERIKSEHAKAAAASTNGAGRKRRPAKTGKR